MHLVRWIRIALVDLRGDTRRFVILLACLVLGVGVIAAVSSVGAALQSAVNRDARAILGGDLEVRSNGHDISPAERNTIEGLGKTVRVVDLNARASANDKGTLLALRAAGNEYPLAGTVHVDPNGTTVAELVADVNGLPGVLVDPQVLTRLGLNVGDSVMIGGSEFAIRGKLLALPDQAAQGFQLGLPALISDTALQTAGLDQPGVLSRYSYKIVMPPDAVSGALATLRKTYPEADWDVRLPKDATANLARFFDLFTRFLTLVGLSSLLVGGVGVSNAVTAYVNERQTSIATLRSLGATSARIMVHFLTQIMTLSLVGTLLGTALGSATTIVALPILSGMLGLDLPPSIDPPSLLAAAAFGLMIGFAFAIVPLRGAQKLRPATLFRSAGSLETALNWRDLFALRTVVPVMIALAAVIGLAIYTTGEPKLVVWYGIGAIAAFALLRMAAWLLQAVLRTLPPMGHAVFRQAINAIYRPGAPAPVVVLSLGLGLALLLMITLLDQNLRTQINGAVAQDAPSFILLDVPTADLPALEAFAQRNSQIETLETIPMLRGTIVSVAGTPTSDLGNLPDDISDMFKGDTTLSWSRDLPAASTVTDGVWWPNDYSGPPQISLSEELRVPLGLKVGDEMTINVAGRPITAEITSFRSIDWRKGGLSFRMLVSPGIIEGAPQTLMGSISVREGEDSLVENSLNQEFPTLTYLPVGDALARISDVLGSLANAVALVGSLAVVSGILVLAGAMAVGRRQREADAVVMKVLGATRRDVVLAFIAEYGLLGALAAVLGAGLGTASAWAITRFVLDDPFAINWELVVATTLGAIFITIGTGVATTWSAMSVRPARQLRAEAI